MKDARERLRMVENQQREIAMRAEGATAVRLWEITLADGRRTNQAALDAEALQNRLQNGARVTGEIFAGGYTVPFEGPSFWDGFIEAHGEQLCSYLADRGFVIRRGDT